jgi:D-alanyl-D-alanine dipeptidase
VSITFARNALGGAILFGAAGCVSFSPAPPVNTADLPIASDAAADSLLRDVRDLAPGIVVELRYATSNNFTGAPIPGYEANHAYLRRQAAEALARVERDLAPAGLGLKIFDAYRPARATEAMDAWTKRVHREDLLRDGYIASKSRHNLGVAVDLTLILLRDSTELELGTPFDTFSAAAHTANATGEAARNRQLLKAAMEIRGFTNYDQEWWHFTFSLPDQRRFDRVIR